MWPYYQGDRKTLSQIEKQGKLLFKKKSEEFNKIESYDHLE